MGTNLTEAISIGSFKREFHLNLTVETLSQGFDMEMKLRRLFPFSLYDRIQLNR